MDHQDDNATRLAKRIPHTRGDGPYYIPLASLPSAYSPHAWGWTTDANGEEHIVKVFPTRVGMDRADAGVAIKIGSIPHTRGDGPLAAGFKSLTGLYSPHAWGWTTR